MKTHYKGGGLRIEDPRLDLAVGLAVAPDFTVPPYVDGRPYCIETSNQGAEPSCAGFTTAGYIEVINWRRTGIKKQVDGQRIYVAAKQMDGDDNPGTSLSQAVRAAQYLQLLDLAQHLSVIRTRRQMEFALHKIGVCIAGFNITEDWNNVNEKTGYIGDGAGDSIGGHAVLISYYDDKCVGWQNSWGLSWGSQEKHSRGFGRMTWVQFAEQFLYAVVLE